MTHVCARKLFPEAGAWRIPVCTGLLAGADRGLLPQKRLGLDYTTYRDRFSSHGDREDQKALQRYAFLASFFVNGGFRYETTR